MSLVSYPIYWLRIGPRPSNRCCLRPELVKSKILARLVRGEIAWMERGRGSVYLYLLMGKTAVLEPHWEPHFPN